MRTPPSRPVLVLSLALCALTTGPALAQPGEAPKLNAQGELNNCPVGLEVLDRRDRRWTITADDRGSCRLVNAAGESGYSMQWMLRPAQGAAAQGRGPAAKAGAAAGGALQAGTYVCNATGAGIFRVTIRSGSAYESAGKAGTYSVAGTSMTFASGALQGQVGRVNHAGQFSLASAPGRLMYTTCDRQ